VQHVIAPGDGLLSDAEVRQITFEELDLRKVVDVAALACNKRVRHPDLMPATHELFRQVRTDETGAAGDQILSHRVPTLAISGPATG
jgi:hypothetical protein